MSKLLSISIAAYNVESTIEQCLDSFLPSKYLAELELLVVNDGSQDRTVELVEPYVQKYPGIIRLINKKNGGHGSTINTSLKIATGKFYKILDGDDWVDVRELDKLIECLRKTRAELIVNDYLEVHPDYTKKISHHKRYENGHVYQFDKLTSDTEFREDIFAMHELTILTQRLRDVNMHIQEHCFYADTEYIYYVGLAARTIEFNDSCAYQYRLGNAGQSVSPEGMYKHIEDLIKIETNLMHMYQCDEKTISSPVRRNYLFAVIDTRYSMLFGCFTNIIQRNDKDQLFIDFLKNVKNKYPDLVNRMHLSKLNQLTDIYPRIFVPKIRKFRKTAMFKAMRFVKHKIEGKKEEC